MAAQAQKIWLCLEHSPPTGCNQWSEYDAALIPAADVPTINQFLSVLGDALYNPTPEAVAYVFAWGMGAVLTMWALGFAVGTVRSVIGKL